MKLTFNNKNIIVTGGSGGIGKAIAKRFLENGANVLILGRSINELTIAQKKLLKISKNIFVKSVDVSDLKQVSILNRFIKTKFKNRVDVLVNAAAIYGPIGKLEESDMGLWEKTIKINLLGTVNMCFLVIPYMKKIKSGKIINFSGGGDGAFPRFTAYSSSKGAILRFTESLAKEVEEYGISVNAIAPGAVNTRLLEVVLKAGKKNVGDNFFNASLDQKKSGGASPDKAADLILFLASEKSKNLSGKIFSAVWDNWKEIPKFISKIVKSDIYNYRRIKPKDRGYDW